MALFPLFKRKSAVYSYDTTFVPLKMVEQLVSGLTSNQKDYLELFLQVPELQAIIGYKARVFSGMNIKAVNKAGDEKDVPLLDLFAKPNPIQGFKEFATQYYLLRSIFGNDFIHPVFGQNKQNVKALWNLPPMDAEVIAVEGGIPFNMTDIDEIIKGYEFTYNGQKIQYASDEIIHFNDNQVTFDTNKWLLGDSKIRPLTQACENIKSAYEARGMLIQKSPLGILSNRTSDGIGRVDMKPEEKKAVQNDFKSAYGMTAQKWHVVLTNQDLNWQSMAADIGRLKLFEEVDHDFRAIANQFNFPPEILQTDSTYENKERALVQLYQEAIIPEANEWLQGLANWMEVDYTLEADFSHIAVLQQDLERRSRSLNMAATGLSKAVQGGIVEQAEAAEEFKKYLL
jgi:HK97 family phage portal protein